MKYSLSVSVPTKPHYVYAYHTSDGPFYIGVGTKGRCLDHLLEARNPHLRRKLTKLRNTGIRIGIKILFETSDRGKANLKEIEIIKRYGRVNEGGILCNIAKGGDGGDTYLGRRMFYNKKTKERKAFIQGQEPKGWLPGTGEYTGPRVCCYNPDTLDITKVYEETDIPKGFIKGLPRGLRTGPKGQIIISNPISKEHKWVPKGTPVPKGWVHGRSHKASTQGRVSCYSLKTGRVRFVDPDTTLPKGWVLGSPNKNGAKAVKVNGKKFESIADACSMLNLSRYSLRKTHKVIFLE